MRNFFLSLLADYVFFCFLVCLFVFVFFLFRLLQCCLFHSGWLIDHLEITWTCIKSLLTLCKKKLSFEIYDLSYSPGPYNNFNTINESKTRDKGKAT